MNQIVTEAIILSRTDYGEADRILSLITPSHGKIHVLAKGVRRVKSKLAGGIELFSVSTVTFIPPGGGAGLGTLVSTRLVQHYGQIVADLDRTMMGYDILKLLNRITEDEAEEAYFGLLHQALVALNDLALSLPLIRLWCNAQLLALGGHTPNLYTDPAGHRLTATGHYHFNFDSMCFAAAPSAAEGPFTADHIKFLRLGFADHPPKVLGAVQGSDQLVSTLAPLVNTMLQTHIRV